MKMYTIILAIMALISLIILIGYIGILIFKLLVLKLVCKHTTVEVNESSATIDIFVKLITFLIILATIILFINY